MCTRVAKPVTINKIYKPVSIYTFIYTVVKQNTPRRVLFPFLKYLLLMSLNAVIEQLITE